MLSGNLIQGQLLVLNVSACDWLSRYSLPYKFIHNPAVYCVMPWENLKTKVEWTWKFFHSWTLLWRPLDIYQFLNFESSPNMEVHYNFFFLTKAVKLDIMLIVTIKHGFYSLKKKKIVKSHYSTNWSFESPFKEIFLSIEKHDLCSH